LCELRQVAGARQALRRATNRRLALPRVKGETKMAIQSLSEIGSSHDESWGSFAHLLKTNGALPEGCFAKGVCYQNKFFLVVSGPKETDLDRVYDANDFATRDDCTPERFAKAQVQTEPWVAHAHYKDCQRLIADADGHAVAFSEKAEMDKDFALHARQGRDLKRVERVGTDEFGNAIFRPAHFSKKEGSK
jgi:hypothetical protein